MPTFRAVLVPVDFSSGSRAALAVARTIARSAKVHLTLLHVYPSVEPQALGESVSAPQYRALDDMTRARLLRELAAIAQPARADVDRLELAVREGDPSREILAYAEEHGVDLIALGTQGRGGLDRLVIGSVAEAVSRKAACSVLTVREPSAGRLPGAALSRIVCAVDLAAPSEATLETALDLAGTLGARLTVGHVIEAWHWDDPWPIARGDEGETRRLLAESARQRVFELLARRESPVPVDVRVVFGRAYPEIVGLIREHSADLVVAGAHAGTVRRLLFGSTAEQLLRDAPCPVLLARPTLAAARPLDAEAEAAAEALLKA
jgi:nucleotide-binding universal stress UspA family protein